VPVRASARKSLLCTAAVLAMTLAGCGGDWNVPKFELRRFETNPAPPGLRPLGPVTADQLVNADGSCAAPGEGQGGGGLALGMTECEVVGRAGAPERVDIAVDEQGRRTVVLTYPRAAHPAIYRFAAGRLTIIEGIPEPPAPAKPVKPKKKPKNKKASAPPAPPPR